MADALADKVLAFIDGAEALYHRLILVAAPSGAGKTEALRQVAESTRVPLVNLNLELSRRMLDLTGRERSLRLPDLLDEVVGRDAPLVLLDNIELWGTAAGEHERAPPQGPARNETSVATGTGRRGRRRERRRRPPECKRDSRAERATRRRVAPTP
ncbi:MAG: BREX-3 system P-loop-containing protein BrxF [Acidobacteria bacterium]|nr:BREX-3 system P-loop-containing protein BrxF [Acidobacteriota bacterium]